MQNIVQKAAYLHQNIYMCTKKRNLYTIFRHIQRFLLPIRVMLSRTLKDVIFAKTERQASTYRSKPMAPATATRAKAAPPPTVFWLDAAPVKGLRVAVDVPVEPADARVVWAPVPVAAGRTEELPVGKGADDVARVEVVTAAAVVVILAEEAPADVEALAVVATGVTISVACLVKPGGRVMPLAAAHWAGVLVWEQCY